MLCWRRWCSLGLHFRNASWAVRARSFISFWLESVENLTCPFLAKYWFGALETFQRSAQVFKVGIFLNQLFVFFLKYGAILDFLPFLRKRIIDAKSQGSHKAWFKEYIPIRSRYVRHSGSWRQVAEFTVATFWTSYKFWWALCFF